MTFCWDKSATIYTYFEMLYNGYNGSESGVGYAISSDGLNWEKLGQLDALGSATIVGFEKENDSYQVWYNVGRDLYYAEGAAPVPEPTTILLLGIGLLGLAGFREKYR